MRALDEVAEAIHAAHGKKHKRRVVNSLALRDQFSVPVTPYLWFKLAQHLECWLPSLEQAPHGTWLLPDGCTSVDELAHHIAWQRNDLEPPRICTSTEWQEAQVFVGVRRVLADAANLNSEEITRPARLVGDLGLN